VLPADDVRALAAEIVVGADGWPAQVRAALEIVDSVWRDHRFGLELNTADGSSAAAVPVEPGQVVSALFGGAAEVHLRRT
jgi:2-polyprenyl-6-methoxyphenol hydroxylase-like FAD-dependent oxidoreductase